MRGMFILTLSLLIASCGPSKYELEEQAEAKRKKITESKVKAILEEHPDAIPFSSLDEHGMLTIHAQRFIEKHKQSLFYTEERYWGIDDVYQSGESLFLEIHETDKVLRIKCSKHSLANIVRQDVDTEMRLIVFFKIDALSKPSLTLETDVTEIYSEDDAYSEVQLDTFNVIIVYATLHSIHEL